MSDGRAGVLTGIVPGATVDEAAVRLAGALAELGEVKIEFRGPGGVRVLDARKTDLPGVIRSATQAGGATLVCLGLGVTVEIGLDRLAWRVEDGETARRFAAAVAG